MIFSIIFLSSAFFFFVCRSNSLVMDGLKLDPRDLELIKGSSIRINCSLCRSSSLNSFNVSDIAFNFTKIPDPGYSSGADQHGNCNEEQELEAEVLSEVYNETDACNVTLDDIDDYLDPSIVEFPLNEKYIRIVNRSTVELTFPSVDETFNDGRLTCYLRSQPRVRADAHVLVGERPHMPVIADVTVRNWKKIEFSWRTMTVNKIYVATYRAWYKNSTSNEFTECPLQPKTTPPPDSPASQLTSLKRCRVFCVADFQLDFHYDLTSSIFVFKVNGSNVVGRVTSEEKVLNLYDVLIPDPVFNLSVEVTNSSTCVMFRSPQLGVTFDYELLFNCNFKLYETFVPSSKVDFVRECESSLPSFSNCVLAVRAKPSGYGNWSERTGPLVFKTPERVPLAAPEVCRSCFEVFHSEKSGNFLVKVFLKPLSYELARGRINQYRLDVRGYGNRTLTFPSTSLTLEVDDLDSSSSAYQLSLTASTSVGYNESIRSNPLIIDPALSYGLKDAIRNVTAFILNSTTVRVSWSDLEPNNSDNSFSVFWCKGETACQHELHSLKVSSNANQQDIVIVPEIELVNYVYGVAFETKHGQSSGISWSRCLHNLSRVSLPPKLGTEFMGESLRLRFRLDDICYGGYPYAFRVLYCELETSRGNEDKACRGESVVRVVNSSATTYDIGRLPSPDRSYLFMVSSLSVAGPSLRSNQMVLDPPANGHPISHHIVFVIAIVGVVVVPLVAVVLVLIGRGKRFYRRQAISIIPPPRYQPGHDGLGTSDVSDNALIDHDYHQPISDVSEFSSSQLQNVLVVRNDDTFSPSNAPLMQSSPSTVSSSENFVIDSAASGNNCADNSIAGSVYRAAGSVEMKQLVELNSPPVTELEFQETNSTDENDCEQKTFVSVDSDYALGRPSERLQSSSSGHSLDGSKNHIAPCIGVLSAPECVPNFLQKPDEGLTEDSDEAIIIDVMKDDLDAIHSDDGDDDYQCASSGKFNSDYATTCLHDRETQMLLETPASDPIFVLDDGSDDDDDDSGSASCPYAAVTCVEKTVLNCSSDFANNSGISKEFVH